MLRTSVGYAGGDSVNPTYHNLGKHTESIQVVFDPSIVSYGQLLEVFWASHDPTTPPWSRQYMSIIFYHDQEQKKAALDSKRQRETNLSRKIYTEIMPLTAFYPAEDYHQKYYLQNEPDIFREYNRIYPDIRQLTASTAAARVNGNVSGYGQLEKLKQQLPRLGLSASGQEKLERIVTKLSS